jgi:hypothetical protein
MEEIMNNGPLNTKPDMSERLRKSRERIEEFRAETQAKARRAVRITNNYAHDHPWRMVATGAALAFAAGLLMNSSRRPRRIVVKTQRPTIKVKAPRPEKKESKFDVVNALLPMALFGLKAYMASKPKNKINPHQQTPSPEMASSPVP